ncbi:calcineurin-like phosphoesterase [Diaporthe helianthi]|uniref:Calcineurin-like phosphoesterase n=1 Tax=Diaporthe helianthi TaxID=158607 RepID=A0A2P5HY16_DIAHE|nr:calcineurin-like phosphoesterase [Diaporthe helianthi]
MASTSFQILSDLHLETHSSYNFPIKHTAQNLALLGDIGQVAHDGLFDFLERQLNRYWNVVFILGNHEPYGTSWGSAKARVRAFEAKMQSLRKTSTIGNFMFLDQGRWDVNENLTVLGCTLFSDISSQMVEVEKRLRDFRETTDWAVEDHITAHGSDLDWLNDQVKAISEAEPQRKIAVFTHYSPTLDGQAIAPRHMDSPISSAFATELGQEQCWTNQAVVFWAFGHTHFNCDFTDKYGKRIIANQKGYASALEADCKIERVYTIGQSKFSGLLL